ncbi:MAG: acyl carrier protein [Halothiobacillus sp. 13-55-253]|jgi:acyl carrier protein|nr:MAG: acyl carrier protein [Halothiobacillus sp. 13-55-253]
MNEAADSVIFDDVRQTVISTLGLDVQAARLTADSPLLGALPELDSMGVVLLLTALEDRFDLVLSDDEIDSAWFETLGALTLAIESRLPH